jgi:SEC-C motif-containing protein
MKCYCKSGKSFNKCCKLFLDNKKEPSSPLELMRSRYTAYVLKNIDYLIKTTYPENRKLYPKNELQEWAESSHFFNLEIINSNQKDDFGTVEFKAYYEYKKDIYIHHEYSTFIKENGVWYFEEGNVFE